MTDQHRPIQLDTGSVPHIKMVTIEQIQLAEVRTRGFLANNNMKQLLEQMVLHKAKEIRWFSLPESDREILQWVGCSP